jgi:hypothetical protein
MRTNETKIQELSNLTSNDELDSWKANCADYAGVDMEEMRLLLDEHTRRVVAKLQEERDEEERIPDSYRRRDSL